VRAVLLPCRAKQPAVHAEAIGRRIKSLKRRAEFEPLEPIQFGAFGHDGGLRMGVHGERYRPPSLQTAGDFPVRRRGPRDASRGVSQAVQPGAEAAHNKAATGR
jgi:hypothetical protein